MIAAVLIMRDEARCIARCLNSVRPFVDRMVVVDTGSQDDSVAIAQACGAQVHHFDWPSDFSVARNHALALADADWNLIIDADEWIASGGEQLHAFCSGAQRMGALCIESGYDMPGTMAQPAGQPKARAWITRLLPRGVQYRGRVHEQPYSTLPTERIDLIIDHDGYLDAQAARKTERNRPLLLAELKRDPGNPYILYQLGAEAEVQKDYVEASRWYGEAFADTPPDAPWAHALSVRHLHCLGQSGRLDEAMDIAGGQMERWQESPDFFFILGNLAMDKALADPAQALTDWLPLAASAWERCLDIGERPDLDGTVAGRGSHLAQHNLDVMRAQLGMLGG